MLEHSLHSALFGHGGHFETSNVSCWFTFSSNIQCFYLDFTEKMARDAFSHADSLARSIVQQREFSKCFIHHPLTSAQGDL